MSTYRLFLGAVIAGSERADRPIGKELCVGVFGKDAYRCQSCLKEGLDCSLGHPTRKEHYTVMNLASSGLRPSPTANSPPQERIPSGLVQSTTVHTTLSQQHFQFLVLLIRLGRS